MEKMSDRERQLLLDLQAKAKRVSRAEAEFLEEADSRQKELLQRWSVKDRLQQAAEQIGTSSEELYQWITSDQQIHFYRRAHGME